MEYFTVHRVISEALEKLRSEGKTEAEIAKEREALLEIFADDIALEHKSFDADYPTD